MNKYWFLMILIGIIIGGLASTQWKSSPARISSPLKPPDILGDILDNLTIQQEDLKRQITDLHNKISAAQEETKKYTPSNDVINQVEKYKDQIGITNIEGGGVVIKMDDSPTATASMDSIAHAADLRDLVNLLWGLDTQAVGINGERVSAYTSIDCIINTILINNTKMTTPFVVSVIGDSDRLADGINENSLPGIYRRVKREGLIFEIEKSKRLNIPAYSGNLQVKYAQID